ncbi:hypothetical protein [Xanthomonas oryzae]|uniref:hypothetical protein n=2 Tax=Xanthomonas oryzae TaxID=347 RepID=UPI001966E550|nr:hypothetical protein [Xanthomonas oryzae]WFC23449.1 hypothetical protein PEV90_14045 [Xanthomonas oryzae pv. oryzae]
MAAARAPRSKHTFSMSFAGSAAFREAAWRKRREIQETGTDAAARNVLYSVVASETLRERNRLRREIRKECQALYADPTNRRLSYREWVEQQAATGDSAAIGQLRGRVRAYRQRTIQATRDRPYGGEWN